MTFLPPPESKRCWAVIQRTGWEWCSGQRCLQRHLAKSDLCRKHLEMQTAGQVVQRVRAPQKVEARG